MNKKQSRIYLPRSTVAMNVIITIEVFAKENNISFGKAIERMLLESNIYNSKHDELVKSSPWMES